MDWRRNVAVGILRTARKMTSLVANPLRQAACLARHLSLLHCRNLEDFGGTAFVAFLCVNVSTWGNAATYPHENHSLWHTPQVVALSSCLLWEINRSHIVPKVHAQQHHEKTTEMLLALQGNETTEKLYWEKSLEVGRRPCYSNSNKVALHQQHFFPL